MFDAVIFDELQVERTEVLFHSQYLEKDRGIGAIILMYLKSGEPQAVFRVMEWLRSVPGVVHAEPDYFIGTHRIPNDPYFTYLWGLKEIDAPLAWEVTTGSERIIVGVLDSGVDYHHPDLRNNVWLALDEQGSDNPMDETGHGTHVAGTIGAVGNNATGVTGVNWRVRLVSLKVGSASFNLAAAIKAIDYANEHKIPILNNSWGGEFYSPALKSAIEYYDGLFVASAGNSGSNNDIFPVYPASYDCNNIISVAATGRNGRLAPFSNYGKTSVDLAAPGADILSTDLHGRYSYLTGTSMAAPYVTGAAVLLSEYRPELSAAEIKEIILSSARRHADLYGRSLTGGVLNIAGMMELASLLPR